MSCNNSMPNCQRSGGKKKLEASPRKDFKMNTRKSKDGEKKEDNKYVLFPKFTYTKETKITVKRHFAEKSKSP